MIEKSIPAKMLEGSRDGAVANIGVSELADEGAAEGVAEIAQTREP